MGKIKVLICDDSALMRTSLKRIVESSPDLFVVGTARDGVDAVAKAKPQGAKGTYIQRVAISSTMGPGVKIDPATITV